MQAGTAGSGMLRGQSPTAVTSPTRALAPWSGPLRRFPLAPKGRYEHAVEVRAVPV